MASIQASRFALLHVDDDYDSDTREEKSNKKQSKQQQTQISAKKKNKKKKKAQQNAEAEELRNLAFNKSGSKHKGGVHHLNGPAGDGGKDQWEQWKKLDEEYTEDHYEKELQAALLASKVEHEQVQQTRAELQAQGVDLNSNGVSGKKKKKNQKKAGKNMTLDQFQNLDKSKLPKSKKSFDDSSSEDEQTSPPPLVPTTSVTNPDPKFFDTVESEVKRELRKEKMQEQYKQSYKLEHMRSQHYETIVEEKDKLIEKLTEDNSSIKAELKQVKKRNQQLCHILSQGEMKDKTKILMEVEELRSVRDELTEEVSTLNAELEKERSKVRQLQSETSSKSKGGKHGK